MPNSVVDDDDFQQILAQTRQFVRTAVVPREQEILATDRVPDDLRNQAKDMGLFGYAIPQEWGGLGLDITQDVELAMELGYTSLALRSMFGTNNGLAAGALIGGSEDIGYRAAMTSLARGRIHIAALAVGAAQRALDESVSYAATATQGGTPIGNFQLVQAMLADQQTGVMAGRALVRDAARLWLTEQDRRIAPSAAKVFCTEMAGKVADLAVQIHGGNGYLREVPVERIYRDVRLLRLYEGTSEIQRLIIGSNLVKAVQK